MKVKVITNCNWCSGNNPQRFDKVSRRLRNQRTSEDHSNYCIIEISKSSKKSPGDLRRFAVIQTPVNNHQLMLMWKTLRKNFKSLFSAGIVLAVGVLNLHISSNKNDWCHSTWVTSQGNIKGSANHSRRLFAYSFASSRTDQSTWESTFSLLHWLFFTDTLSHILSRTDHLFPLSPLSSPQSIMRRAHPIYGPLVSGKSFIHQSSFLLNQRILGETNWIFSTPALTSAF